MNTEKPVVFYGAGNHAHHVFKELSEKYSPVAFCDGDKTKQGSTLYNLPVMSLSEVMEKYPGSAFYVTADGGAKFEIVNILTQNNISPDRILNYEQMKRYKSCQYLEEWMIIGENIYFCCADFGNNRSPNVEFSENHEKTLENFFSFRDRTIEELNLTHNSIENSCLSCYRAREGWWGEKRHIKHVNLGFKPICNFKCCYCVVKDWEWDKVDSSKSLDKALSFFKFLVKQSHITKDTTIGIGSGELLVHPMREKILAAIENYPVYFYTNASVFNEKVAEILSKGKSKIVVSMDAGTRETFAKIKGIDIFDKVCENLRRYSEYGFVELKYIFLPGVNDNKTEIDGFLALCQMAKVKSVNISRNMLDMNALDEQTLTMIADLVGALKDAGITTSLPGYIFTGSEDKEKILSKLS